MGEMRVEVKTGVEQEASAPQTRKKKRRRKEKEQMKSSGCALGMFRNIPSHRTGLELHHSDY